jgi:hypothetical protein
MAHAGVRVELPPLPDDPGVPQIVLLFYVGINALREAILDGLSAQTIDNEELITRCANMNAGDIGQFETMMRGHLQELTLMTHERLNSIERTTQGRLNEILDVMELMAFERMWIAWLARKFWSGFSNTLRLLYAGFVMWNAYDTLKLEFIAWWFPPLGPYVRNFQQRMMRQFNRMVPPWTEYFTAFVFLLLCAALGINSWIWVTNWLAQDPMGNWARDYTIQFGRTYTSDYDRVYRSYVDKFAYGIPLEYQEQGWHWSTDANKFVKNGSKWDENTKDYVEDRFSKYLRQGEYLKPGLIRNEEAVQPEEPTTAEPKDDMQGKKDWWALFSKTSEPTTPSRRLKSSGTKKTEDKLQAEIKPLLEMVREAAEDAKNAIELSKKVSKTVSMITDTILSTE